MFKDKNGFFNYSFSVQIFLRVLLALTILALPWILLWVDVYKFFFSFLTEKTASILAATLEVGLPLAMLLSMAFVKKTRKTLAVLAGATTPVILFASFLIWDYLSNPEENAWAFGAAWVMGFFVYSLLFTTGLALTLVFPERYSTLTRFAAGFFLCPLVVMFLLKF